jgi:excinuclease UvrABC nuclease subunit
MSLEFRPVKEGRTVAQWVRELKGRSGVYLIREKTGFLFFSGDVVYIGESHTNRLNTTLLRHFQRWTGKTAGATFAVSKVEVAIVRCPASHALTLQNALIEEYRPRLNTVANPDAEKA